MSEVESTGTITAVIVTAVRRQHWDGWDERPDWDEWDVTSTDGYSYYLPIMEDCTPQLGDRLTVWLETRGGPALAFRINDGLRIPMWPGDGPHQ